MWQVLRYETTSQKYNELMQKYYSKTRTSNRKRFSLWCLVTFFTDEIVPSDLVQNEAMCTSSILKNYITQLSISYETNHTLKPGKKIRGGSLWFFNTLFYMHISWFIHISHITVRALRPKPLLKGLSSKASEKITHRLKVFSRAVGLLKATRLHHVPQAVSWMIV